MYISQHAQQRMSQRGISKEILNLTMEYGELHHDKVIMSKKLALKTVRELEAKLQTAKKILDKGGCVVVEAGAAVVTTYNFRP